MAKKLSINIIFSKEFPESVLQQMKKNLEEKEKVPETMRNIYRSFDPKVDCDITIE